MEQIVSYPTIRQEAKYGGTLGEHALRAMLARGELPGFYTGRTFRVNHAQLVERLNQKSVAGLKCEEVAM